MTEKECPFCKIDPEHTEVIEENPLYLVILSNPRLILGHTLVLPRRHVEQPWELKPEERVAVYDTVLRYQQRIIDRFATGCDVRQNYRPFIPQGRLKVDHVHFHLLPRTLEDEYFKVAQVGEKSLWTDLSAEERQNLKKLFS